MGVDASIYAKRAKRSYYFDRLRNLQNDANYGTSLDGVEKRLREHNPNQTLTKDEVIALVYAKLEHNPDKWFYMGGIEAFVTAFPDDEFFVIHDHQDGGPETEGLWYHDWEVKHGYVRWLREGEEG